MAVIPLGLHSAVICNDLTKSQGHFVNRLYTEYNIDACPTPSGDLKTLVFKQLL